MTEVRTGIPEAQVQKAKVIDLQAVRQQRLAEGKPVQAPKLQPETLPKEEGKESIVASFPTEKPVSPETEQTRYQREETETREGLAAVREKLREEQQVGEESPPVTGEIAAPGPNSGIGSNGNGTRGSVKRPPAR